MIGARAPGWGIDWGFAAEIPSDARTADSDAAAAEIFAQARRSGRRAPPVLLTGGDLARTLGVTSGVAAAADTESSAHAAAAAAGSAADAGPRNGVCVPVDVGAALIDGRLHWFVAHLVARRSWWRGRLLAAANVAFIGSWNAAPRSHPGDGRLDVFDTQPSLRVRLAARRRLGSGTHVPHPQITQRRVKAAQYDFDPSLDVYLDGRRLRRARTLSVRVEPRALQAWIRVPP